MWASFTKSNDIIMQVCLIRHVCVGFCTRAGLLEVRLWICDGGFWYWVVRSVAFYRAETDARDSPERKTNGLKSRAVYFLKTTANLAFILNLKGMVHSLIVPNLCKLLFFCWTQKKIFWRMQVTKQLTVAIDLVFIQSYILSFNIPKSIFIIIRVHPISGLSILFHQKLYDNS